jgi:hypothetical protein
MTHDPMCPTRTFPRFVDGAPDFCPYCDFIAKVEARAVQRVEALTPHDYCYDHDCRMKAAVIAAIKGENE